MNASGFTTSDDPIETVRAALLPLLRDAAAVSAALDGVLVVDKPEGMTSHDVVATVRRRLPRKTKVGHTGTLDPFATGVLPIVIGKATRLSQFLTAGRKRYLARRWHSAPQPTPATGWARSSRRLARGAGAAGRRARGRGAGRLRRHAAAGPASALGQEGRRRARLRAGAAGRGRRPPPRRGDSARAGARARGTPARRRRILDLDVSAGYYVRSLARDLGARLGVPAHLTALRRTGSGAWSLEDAHSLAEVVAVLARRFAPCVSRWPRCCANGRDHRRSPAGRGGAARAARRPGRRAGRSPRDAPRSKTACGSWTRPAPSSPWRGCERPGEAPRRHRPAVTAVHRPGWRKSHRISYHS